MKKIYNYMFVEICYSLHRSMWKRFSENYKSQIEMINPAKLYWRGIGGGFFLYVMKANDNWVYLSKYKKTITHRINKKDYDRLASKFEKSMK